MQSASAKEEILERALSIEPGQFEQLCRILIKESEPTRELELTPQSGDEGIDVHAVIDRRLFLARLGVQAKRNEPGNSVSSNTMRTFKGSLQEGNYHIGTFITTSSFSNPAVRSAEGRYIRLIDGEMLGELMAESEIGVVKEQSGYAIDWDFWELFEIERDDLIRSDAIPQADSIDVLNVVITAINHGNHVKPEIHAVMEAETGRNWRDRQADYYAQAGWALGLVHKDTNPDDDTPYQRWTLSSAGKEYAELLEEGNRNEARQLLILQIREMEIAQRALSQLEKQGSMEHTQLEEIVFENSLPEELDRGLKRSTANRRAKSVGVYISQLPEVKRHGDDWKNTTYEYIRKNLTDYS